MYPKRVPSLFQVPLGTLTWRIPEAVNEVFLTFDDGPTPEITHSVLDILDEYNAKATFFLIGKNVEAHPEIVQAVLDAGHSIGHHSYSHVNGWKLDRRAYIEDVERAAALVESDLFRPPYGRISPRKAKALSKKYRIIMWTILSGDFDTEISGADCVNNVVNTLKPGDIVVFHDSVKAWPRLKEALPKILQHIQAKGWQPVSLPSLWK